eukprot:TRINITY_DN8572_c0_g1_i1.p1 TRINITY_DN8572_c0_g1~~TRINITY_DN8572_c0_g1_i1.p1  ORF type:complete len:493 (-),score=65.77 TRINITY_DN8572_c0_g1_i1:34-1407(-)
MEIFSTIVFITALIIGFFVIFTTYDQYILVIWSFICAVWIFPLWVRVCFKKNCCYQKIFSDEDYGRLLTDGYIEYKPAKRNTSEKLLKILLVLNILVTVTGVISFALLSEIFTSIVCAVSVIGSLFYLMVIIENGEKEQDNRKWVNYLLIVVYILFFFLALGSVVNATISAIEFDSYPPHGDIYDVTRNNQTHKMHINCIGTGSPTILLFHGLGGQALDWSWIQPSLSNLTKTCSFDRSGYGWSEPGTLPRDSRQISLDTRELFKAANIVDHDVILVGHSMAGFNMRVYHGYFPEKTLGMVCLDCVDPQNIPEGVDQYEVPLLYSMGRYLNALGIQRLVFALTKTFTLDISLLPTHVHTEYLMNVLKYKYIPTWIYEWSDFPMSGEETVSTGNLGDMPFLVFAAGKGLNNTGLTRLSEDSRLITLDDCDHMIPFREKYANIVVEKVKELVEEVRELN